MAMICLDWTVRLWNEISLETGQYDCTAGKQETEHGTGHCYYRLDCTIVLLEIKKQNIISTPPPPPQDSATKSGHCLCSTAKQETRYVFRLQFLVYLNGLESGHCLCSAAKEQFSNVLQRRSIRREPCTYHLSPFAAQTVGKLSRAVHCEHFRC